MGYMVFIMIILGILFSGVTGHHLLGIDSAVNQAKTSLLDFVFPKGEKEVLVNNITDQYGSLDSFFTQQVPKILESKLVPEQQKQQIRQAVKTFTESKQNLSQLKQVVAKDNKSLIQATVEKILGLDNNKLSNEPQQTYLPPECHTVEQVVCSK